MLMSVIMANGKEQNNSYKFVPDIVRHKANWFRATVRMCSEFDPHVSPVSKVSKLVHFTVFSKLDSLIPVNRQIRFLLVTS